MSTLPYISATLLDAASPASNLEAALDAFSAECSYAGGVTPDRSFNAWAQDRHLENGLAINPQAAAHCVTDYQRSVVFIRAVYSALRILEERFPGTALKVLYAGCGPYATLLLPVIHRFLPGRLDITFLDVHQPSLDSVLELLSHFEESTQRIETVCHDASTYEHPEQVHLIITETMQKSLEQEPQFAVTAKLAPQLCPGGLFIPEKVDVNLKLISRIPGAVDSLAVGQVLSLRPNQLVALTTILDIPQVKAPDKMAAVLSTDIQAFRKYCLRSGESELTLDRPCPELTPVKPGATCEISYRMGAYPGFELNYQ